MNPLVQKEIRLLAPSCGVAMLLACCQAVTRPYDFYIVALMFFGMTIMALATFGRESSLNTFSGMLAQPADRLRIWQTKISVLATAFLLVFVIWFIGFVCASIHSSMNVASLEAENSYNLLVAICLLVTATFTGGLWATLLLRQIAGAFWLSLLVPATLSGLAAAILAVNQSDEFTITVLCIVLGIYSISGFFFARWLFFRAQDVGWTGGNIVLPDWRIFSSRSAFASSIRTRKPIFALLKKEFQLQQVPLLGAIGLLILHTGIIFWRTHHTFAHNSGGEILTSVFWILWLILPVMVGSLAIAEERRLGLMDTQSSLPASRRLQFAIKISLVLFLGVLLGGVLPMLLENIGIAISGKPLIPLSSGDSNLIWFQPSIIGLAAWLTITSFFGSSLAKNFLQAIGFAIVTFCVCATCFSAFMNGRMFFFDSIPTQSILSLAIAVPTLLIAIPWLAYLNYQNFREGWPLWRRNLLGVVGAILVILVVRTSLYHRPWEAFEPLEPAHGAPKLSLADAPRLTSFYPLQVQLPDGRVWVCELGNLQGYWETPKTVGAFFHYLFSTPFPFAGGEQRFIAGSNWLSVVADSIYLPSGEHLLVGIGIRPDGTLWVSTNSLSGKPSSGQSCLDAQPNWQQISVSRIGLLLLKKDGTLWRWEGEYSSSFFHYADLAVPDLLPVCPDARWKELFQDWPGYARKSDNTVWSFQITKIHGRETLQLEKSKYLEQASFDRLSRSSHGESYVGSDGSPRILTDVPQGGPPTWLTGEETNCQAVVIGYTTITALNTDGSLWQWDSQDSSLSKWNGSLPTRLGIHNDWVAITAAWNGIFTLAADGSLWFWPDHKAYEYDLLLKFPKQPRKIANIFDPPKLL